MSSHRISQATISEHARQLIEEFELPLDGPHGPGHWSRVYMNATQLSFIHKIDPLVPQLFAIFHDAARISDGSDPDHGERGAELAMTRLRGVLTPSKLDLLCKACRFHSRPIKTDNLIIQTCWDSDRLDLGRLDIALDNRFLNPATVGDQQFCETAYGRGKERIGVPPLSAWQSIKGSALDA